GHDTNALDTLWTVDECHCARAVANGDTMLRSRLVFRLDQPGTAAICIDDDAAEELEPALMVIGLSAVVRQELDALAHEPVHGVGAVGDQCLGEIGIDVVLCDPPEVIEILFC